MLSSSSITASSNFSMPLNFGSGGATKNLFNITSSGHFNPPPPPGGMGAPFSPLFNQPVFNLVPAITIDLSFLKDLTLPNTVTDLTNWIFSKLAGVPDKDPILSKHNVFNLVESATSKFERLHGGPLVHNRYFVYGASSSRNTQQLEELAIAVKDGNMELLRSSATQGFNFKDAKLVGLSFAHIAAANGQRDTLEFLREQGVALDTPITNERQAIQKLSELSMPAIKGALLGVTPAHLAAAYAKLEVLQFLSDSGVNLNRASKSGMTPLILACSRNGNRAVLEWFLSKEFSFDVQFMGHPLLFVAAGTGAIDVLHFLYEKRDELGINFDELIASPSTKLNPMLPAVLAGEVEALVFLAERGADLGISLKGSPLSEYAAVEGQAAVIQLLNDRDHLQIDEATGIKLACFFTGSKASDDDTLAILRLFNDRGVNLLAAHDDGHPAVRWAVMSNKASCVRYLHGLGEDIARYFDLAVGKVQVLEYYLEKEIPRRSKAKAALNAAKMFS